MLSRLKGIETIQLGSINEVGRVCALDMLSRLKGIETVAGGVVGGVGAAFGYAFPFEGN